MEYVKDRYYYVEYRVTWEIALCTNSRYKMFSLPRTTSDLCEDEFDAIGPMVSFEPVTGEK